MRAAGADDKERIVAEPLRGYRDPTRRHPQKNVSGLRHVDGEGTALSVNFLESSPCTNATAASLKYITFLVCPPPRTFVYRSSAVNQKQAQNTQSHEAP